MSVDPILLQDNSPMLVSPFERFLFVLDDVTFNVFSGAGYPGQGGVFYGKRGRLYLSSYRLVYVEMDPTNRHFRSFSLPLYAIASNHRFRTLYYMGKPTYEGVVAPVPGGGLVGPGKFCFTFLGVGFPEFKSFYEPIFQNSRSLFAQMQALPQASIVQVPGPVSLEEASSSKQLAFISPFDPFTLRRWEARHHYSAFLPTYQALKHVSLLSGFAAVVVNSGLGRLQSLLRPKKEPEVAKPKPMPSLSKAAKDHQDARLAALWQLLVTGFELIKYPKTGRARKRVLWLTLDGRLCVGRAKSDKHMGTFMHLWDIERVDKGCASSPQFATSKSSQDAQEELCWSIQATSAKEGSTYSFALQVISCRVRDLVVENLSMLIQLLHPNDVPRGVRARLAVHFASTGELLADLEPFMEILDSLEGDNDHGGHQDDSDSGEEEERLG